MVEAQSSAGGTATEGPASTTLFASRASPVEDALLVRLKSMDQRLAGKSYKDGLSADERRRIVEALTAAGSAIGSGAGRDWLRNALFFWASEQMSHGERERFAPAPVLDEFTAASPPEVVLAWLQTSAGHAPAALSNAPSATGSAPGDTFGSAHEWPAPDVHAVRPSGDLATKIPQSAGEPPQALPDVWSDAPAGPDPELASEVVRGDRAVPDAIAHSPVPSSSAWRGRQRGRAASSAQASSTVVTPPLATASELTEDEARRLVRISALARQWRLTDEPNRKGYLIDERVALQDASRFTLLDPDIRDLVEASEAHVAANERSAQRRRTLLISLVIATLLALLAAATAALFAEESQRLALTRINTAEKAEILRKVQAATDAMKRQDIQPLLTVLTELGANDTGALALLDLKKSSDKERDSDSTAKLPNRTPVSQLSELSQPDPCVGYLWLGSKADSRLDDHRDPATVSPGDVVTMDQRADIRLRSGLPDQNRYSMAPQSGVVPAGAKVKILGAPVPFKRNQDQIWAQVGVPRAYCTTVYVQYTGNDAARADVLNALGDVGVVTPPAQLIQTAKGLAEVRYYWAADKPIAEQVATALARFNKGKPLAVVPLLTYPSKPASGIMEVWVDLGS